MKHEHQWTRVLPKCKEEIRVAYMCEIVGCKSIKVQDLTADGKVIKETIVDSKLPEGTIHALYAAPEIKGQKPIVFEYKGKKYTSKPKNKK